MRLVLGNRLLVGPGGTEVHLVTVGEHLRRLGHETVLYAPELGPFAEHARARGLDVRDDLRDLPEECDVVFAQDMIVVHDLARRYPEALTIFRICGDVFDFQLPPQVEGVVDLLVALSDRYERIARACAVRVPILRLRVPIDIDRLMPFTVLRERPQRAILLGNYPLRDQAIAEAWGAAGVEVKRVGADTPTYDVAGALLEADIVVAKSRAALDAMACGRAVYVYDVFGGDGWVTADLYPRLEADHFAGQATGRVIDAKALAEDLEAYTPAMSQINRDLVVQHHSARDHVVHLLDEIGRAVPEPHVPAPLDELSRLANLQWTWEQSARQFEAKYWQLRAQLDACAHGWAETTRELESARATIDALERGQASRDDRASPR